MAHPEDDLDRAPEMRRKCVYMQESGYEGLSSNMKHKCYDDSVKKAQPVDKDSFVKPIPKEEDDLEVGKGSPAEQVSVLEPTLVSDDDEEKEEEEEESLKEQIEEHSTKALKEPTSSSVQKSKRHIAAATSDEVTVATGSSNVATKMGEQNGRLSYKRRASRNLFLLVSLFGYLLHPAGAFPAKRVKCFTCNDMERCPNVGRIFDQNDERVFNHKEADPFPLCADTPEPDSNKCNMCRYQQNIHIYCFDNVISLEAEDDRSYIQGKITNITEGCVPLESSDPGLNEGESNAAGSAHSLYGIGIFGVPVLWVAILLAFCRRKYRGHVHYGNLSRLEMAPALRDLLWQ